MMDTIIANEAHRYSLAPRGDGYKMAFPTTFRSIQIQLSPARGRLPPANRALQSMRRYSLAPRGDGYRCGAW